MQALTNQNVLKTVFSFLDQTPFAVASIVCKDWNLASKADHLWKDFCCRDGLFRHFPLEPNETWKQRFDTIQGWRKENCTQEAFYDIGKDRVLIGKNIYKLTVKEDEVSFHNIETNGQFTLKAPNHDKLIDAVISPSHIVLRSKDHYHIFNRETREFIRSVPHELTRLRPFNINSKFMDGLLDDNSIVLNIETGQQHRIDNTTLIDNKLFRIRDTYWEFIDLSAEPFQWNQLPHSNITAYYRALHIDQDRLIEIAYNRLCDWINVKIWNLNDLNAEPLEKVLQKPGRIGDDKSIILRYHHWKIIENILIFEGFQSICAWDIQSGTFLFEKDCDGFVEEFFVDKNRLLAKINGIYGGGMAILDFGVASNNSVYLKGSIPKEYKFRYIMNYLIIPSVFFFALILSTIIVKALVKGILNLGLKYKFTIIK